MSAEPYPDFLFARQTLRAVVERAGTALRTSTGFSLVRLGDGEGPILGWPDDKRPAELATVLSVWFGRKDLPPADMQIIADGLRRAVRSADVVGLPTRFQLGKSPRYGMVMDAIVRHDLLSPSQLLADSGLHWYLQWSGALAHLLRGVPSAGVIGCRGIGPQIADAFGLRDVRTYLVRGEHRYPGAVSEPHWPDGFHKVMGQLQNDIRPGMMFLVGAGVLGKIYCDLIKTKGGVALDIGSLLDSWANVPSRDSFASASSAFTLEHFKTTGASWEDMAASLHRWKDALHARDATTTL